MTANCCTMHLEGKKNLRCHMPRTYFQKMKIGNAQVYTRHTLEKEFHPLGS